MTSGPMPSPGIAAITYSRMSRLPVRTLSQDISPKEGVPQKRSFGSDTHLYEICTVASRAAPQRPELLNALCFISSSFLLVAVSLGSFAILCNAHSGFSRAEMTRVRPLLSELQ